MAKKKYADKKVGQIVEKPNLLRRIFKVDKKELKALTNGADPIEDSPAFRAGKRFGKKLQNGGDVLDACGQALDAVATSVVGDSIDQVVEDENRRRKKQEKEDLKKLKKDLEQVVEYVNEMKK